MTNQQWNPFCGIAPILWLLCSSGLYAFDRAFDPDSKPNATDRPNVILCMADDMGWGDPGFNGNRIIQTPNLDEMASNGLRFDRFYSGGPVCSPTRGSCLTGRHPYRYAVWSANQGHLRKPEMTLAEVLQTQGYSTGHFG